MKIPFNIPYLTGKEGDYILHYLNCRNGAEKDSFYDRSRDLIKKLWGFNEVFLTHSCTGALEMCALLLDIKSGDEVIVPSFTFVSSAQAFARQGAKIIFADSRKDHPGIDEEKIAELISDRTKAIVVVHYAGIACDMKKISEIASHYGIPIVEDAALAIDAYYKSKPLGSIGSLGCLSFNSTKNIQCGEGGALIINDPGFLKRAEYIHEKGTDKNDFNKGLINEYEWVDIGSSFRMPELTAAFLYAQLEAVKEITRERKFLWEGYFENLKMLNNQGVINLPVIPEYSNQNYHSFYLVCRKEHEKTELQDYLLKENIQAVRHYVALDKSIYWKKLYPADKINFFSDRYDKCLLRLPLYNKMTEESIKVVTDKIIKFFENSIS